MLSRPPASSRRRSIARMRLFPPYLEASGALGHLVPRLASEPVQTLGEALGELPDGGSFRPAHVLSPSGAAGAEIVSASADGLSEDDLRPLVVEEFRVPATLAELVEHRPPFPHGLAVVDGLFTAARLGFSHNP